MEIRLRQRQESYAIGHFAAYLLCSDSNLYQVFIKHPGHEATALPPLPQSLSQAAKFCANLHINLAYQWTGIMKAPHLNSNRGEQAGEEAISLQEQRANEERMERKPHSRFPFDIRFMHARLLSPVM